MIAHEPQDLVNAKDPEALGLLFAEDAEFVNILGMRMRGREGIVADHAWAFSGPPRGRHVRSDAIDELAVTDDVSICRPAPPCWSSSRVAHQPLGNWQLRPM